MEVTRAGNEDAMRGPTIIYSCITLPTTELERAQRTVYRVTRGKAVGLAFNIEGLPPLGGKPAPARSVLFLAQSSQAGMAQALIKVATHLQSLGGRRIVLPEGSMGFKDKLTELASLINDLKEVRMAA